MLAVLPAASSGAVEANGHRRSSPTVVVANRGSGDISVIDTRTHSVDNVDLPGEAEPMYVSHDPRQDRVFVGDRAASQMIVLDDDTFEVVDSVDVGDGVFHQWLDPVRRQLWVVGDSSQTVTVVDTRTLEVRTTIAMPADVADSGGKPHDVFVSGRFAYVTILGFDDDNNDETPTVGQVIQYSTRDFAEVSRTTVGDDPHVFVRQGVLYVASQDSSEVATFNARTMRLLRTTTVSAAHGIFVTGGGEVLVTSIADGGTNAVSELNRRITRVVDTVDTSVPVPHNLTVDGRRQMYVTHSGPTADQVSIVPLRRNGFGDPVTVTVGTNPFGLAFVR
ncbi:MAG: hypothetical protein ACRBK7_04110 [Acidimicrobiales bacterium]